MLHSRPSPFKKRTNVEPSNYLTSSCGFVARTLVDTDCDDVVISVVNLSNQTRKINQRSVLGKQEDVEEIYSGDSNSSTNRLNKNELPDHLQICLENVSSKLSETQKQNLSEMLAKYEDNCIKPDGFLGPTDVVEHEIETGDSIQHC